MMLAGILIGSITSNVFILYHRDLLSLFTLEIFNVQGITEISKTHLLFYVGWKRIKQFFILACLCVFTKPIIVLSLGAFILGIVFGAFLSLETMNLGLQGIFTACMYLLPQYIFYGYGYGMAVKYYGQQNVNENKFWEKKTKEKKFIFFLIELCILVVGCLAEAYINPIFIKNFSQYLVQ